MTKEEDRVSEERKKKGMIDQGCYNFLGKTFNVYIQCGANFVNNVWFLTVFSEETYKGMEHRIIIILCIQSTR